MRDRGRLVGVALIIPGLALLAWLLYDATSVVSTLGLDAIVDEASVAVGGLAAGGVLIATGIVCWRRARGRTSAMNAL